MFSQAAIRPGDHVRLSVAFHVQIAFGETFGGFFVSTFGVFAKTFNEPNTASIITHFSTHQNKTEKKLAKVYETLRLSRFIVLLPLSLNHRWDEKTNTQLRRDQVRIISLTPKLGSLFDSTTKKLPLSSPTNAGCSAAAAAGFTWVFSKCASN